MSLPEVRRVVTAYNNDGVSVFASDKPVAKVAPPAGNSATRFSVSIDNTRSIAKAILSASERSELDF